MNKKIKFRSYIFKLISFGMILTIALFHKFEIKNYIKKFITFNKIFLINSKYKKCDFQQIENVPKNSIVIVGHAYGSPLTKEEFISNKVDIFLKENIKNINTIIFTGDIFKNPTREKWNTLKKKYGGLGKILVSPGNHDVRLSNQSYGQKFYDSSLSHDLPYKKKFKDLEIVVEDSTKTDWLIEEEIFSQINQIDNRKIAILVRHNIPIKELEFLSNSFDGYKGGLQKLDDLNNSISRTGETIIFSGDGGAFSYLPRLFCLQNNKLKLIINGVGDIKNDIVFVISENRIYSFKLKDI